MRRATKIVLVALIATAAATAAVAGRKAILAWAIESYLSAHGYPGTHLTVTEFTLDRITLESIAAPAVAPTVARVAVTSYLNKNFEINVDGLRVPIDLSRAAAGGSGLPEAVRGFLEHALEPERVPRAFPWPKVVVHDAAVVIRGLEGGEIVMSGGGTADFRPLPRVTFQGKVSSAHTNALFRFETDESAKEPGLRVELSGQSDLAVGPWPAGVPRPASGRASFSLESTVPLAVIADIPGQAAGGHSVKARLDLRLDSVALPSRVKSLAVDMSLRAIAGDGKARISLPKPMHISAQGITVPELAALGPAGMALADRLSGAVEITLAGGSPALPVDTPGVGRMDGAALGVPENGEPVLVSIEKDEDGWRQNTSATITAAILGGTATLQLRAHTSLNESFQPSGRQTAGFQARAKGISLGAAELRSFSWQGAADMAQEEYSAQGPLALRLSKLDEAHLPGAGLSYSGDVQMSGGPDRLSIAAQKPGMLSLTGVRRIAALRLDGPLNAVVTTARADRDTKGVVLEAALAPDAINGEVVRDSGNPIPFRVKAGEVSVRARVSNGIAGEARVKAARVAFPAIKIAFDKIDGATPFAIGAAPKPKPGKITAILHSEATPALFAPLAVDFDVVQYQHSIDGKGQIELAGDKATAAVAGSFDLEHRQGALHLGPASLIFAPDALQPADLGPALASLAKAKGRVVAEGTVGYAPASGATARGQLTFEPFSFETPQANVEDLTGTLDFVDLLQPRTAPRQNLTAKRVTAVAALDDVALHFGLAMEDDGPVVAISEATGDMAGGTLALRDATLRLGATSNAATVEVNGISLGRLLEQLRTENVSGTGILSGSIPLRFGTAGFAVENGKIQAQEPGALHVNLGSAKETLEKQGQAMSLMVQALEDFHYTLLEVGVSRPAGGDMTLAIKLEGMNPAVLDGHPFRFNINLTGNLERLVAALRAGTGLTAGVLEGAVGLTR